ncbi:hypothetical protein [Dactylosporangium sp. CA-233914]|uniref:hypothetical protein n=1 Tax=Dactylosporangium sp. CA-233914 TaxID=3239934 RepID=UPI003D93C676
MQQPDPARLRELAQLFDDQGKALRSLQGTLAASLAGTGWQGTAGPLVQKAGVDMGSRLSETIKNIDAYVAALRKQADEIEKALKQAMWMAIIGVILELLTLGLGAMLGALINAIARGIIMAASRFLTVPERLAKFASGFVVFGSIETGISIASQMGSKAIAGMDDIAPSWMTAIDAVVGGLVGGWLVSETGLIAPSKGIGGSGTRVPVPKTTASGSNSETSSFGGGSSGSKGIDSAGGRSSSAAGSDAISAFPGGGPRTPNVRSPESVSAASTTPAPKGSPTPARSVSPSSEQGSSALTTPGQAPPGSRSTPQVRAAADTGTQNSPSPIVAQNRADKPSDRVSVSSAGGEPPPNRSTSVSSAGSENPPPQVRNPGAGEPPREQTVARNTPSSEPARQVNGGRDANPSMPGSGPPPKPQPPRGAGADPTAPQDGPVNGNRGGESAPNNRPATPPGHGGSDMPATPVKQTPSSGPAASGPAASGPAEKRAQPANLDNPSDTPPTALRGDVHVVGPGAQPPGRPGSASPSGAEHVSGPAGPAQARPAQVDEIGSVVGTNPSGGRPVADSPTGTSSTALRGDVHAVGPGAQPPGRPGSASPSGAEHVSGPAGPAQARPAQVDEIGSVVRTNPSREHPAADLQTGNTVTSKPPGQRSGVQESGSHSDSSGTTNPATNRATTVGRSSPAEATTTPADGTTVSKTVARTDHTTGEGTKRLGGDRPSVRDSGVSSVRDSGVSSVRDSGVSSGGAGRGTNRGSADGVSHSSAPDQRAVPPGARGTAMDGEPPPAYGKHGDDPLLERGPDVPASLKTASPERDLGTPKTGIGTETATAKGAGAETGSDLAPAALDRAGGTDIQVNRVRVPAPRYSDLPNTDIKGARAHESAGKRPEEPAPAYGRPRDDEIVLERGPDVPGWLKTASPERDLVTPKTRLDDPMSGINQNIDKIRAEQRGSIEQGIEAKAGRTEPTAVSRPGDEVANTTGVSARSQLGDRELAWDAMNKHEASVRQTLGDGAKLIDGRAAWTKTTPAPRTERPAGGESRPSGAGATAAGAGAEPGAAPIKATTPAPRAERPAGGETRPPDAEALRADYQVKQQRADALKRRQSELDGERDAVVRRTNWQVLGTRPIVPGTGEHGPDSHRLTFEPINERVSGLRELGVDVRREQLTADPAFARADAELTRFATERALIGNVRQGLAGAINDAARQVAMTAETRVVDEASARAREDANQRLDMLTDFRDRGLSSLGPEPLPPLQETLYQQLRGEGVALDLRPVVVGPRPADIDPGRVEDTVRELSTDLLAARNRFLETPTPRPNDPDWQEAYPGVKADQAIRDWADAYANYEHRWNELTPWQQAGVEPRDAQLKVFERTAFLRREQAIVTTAETLVRDELGRAARLAEDARIAMVRAGLTPEPARPQPQSEPAEPKARPATPNEPPAPSAHPAASSAHPAALSAPPAALRDGRTRPSEPDTESVRSVDTESVRSADFDTESVRSSETDADALRSYERLDDQLRSSDNPFVRPAHEPGGELVRPPRSRPDDNSSATTTPELSQAGVPLTEPSKTVPYTAPPFLPRTVAADNAEATNDGLFSDRDPLGDRDWRSALGQATEAFRDGLRDRIGTATLLDRDFPNLTVDFARVHREVPGASRLGDAVVADTFGRFGEAATREFAEAMGRSADEVRAPSETERAAWQERYGELLDDLRNGLRERVGETQIAARANEAYRQWHAEGEAETVSQPALRAWTEAATDQLQGIRAAGNWDRAAGKLAEMVDRLPVYRVMHQGADRMAERAAAQFADAMAGRPAVVDPERVTAARREAMDAAREQYLNLWAPRYIMRAVTDPQRWTRTIELGFQDLAPAIRNRITYLVETQPVLDMVERMTEPAMLEPRLRDPLSDNQKADLVRIVRGGARSIVDERAPGFVADPPKVDEAMLRRVRFAVNQLLDGVPGRAVFAVGASRLAADALVVIGAAARAGAMEAERRGLDASGSVGRAAADARRAVGDAVAKAREALDARVFEPAAVEAKLAKLRDRINAIVAGTRLETVRDALLRRGDQEALRELNEQRTGPGDHFTAPARERVYQAYERDVVDDFHSRIFGPDTNFDVEAWLRSTPPVPYGVDHLVRGLGPRFEYHGRLDQAQDQAVGAFENKDVPGHRLTGPAEPSEHLLEGGGSGARGSASAGPAGSMPDVVRPVAAYDTDPLKSVPRGTSAVPDHGRQFVMTDNASGQRYIATLSENSQPGIDAGRRLDGEPDTSAGRLDLGRGRYIFEEFDPATGALRPARVGSGAKLVDMRPFDTYDAPGSLWARRKVIGPDGSTKLAGFGDKTTTLITVEPKTKRLDTVIAAKQQEIPGRGPVEAEPALKVQMFRLSENGGMYLRTYNRAPVRSDDGIEPNGDYFYLLAEPGPHRDAGWHRAAYGNGYSEELLGRVIRPAGDASGRRIEGSGPGRSAEGPGAVLRGGMLRPGDAEVRPLVYDPKAKQWVLVKVVRSGGTRAGEEGAGADGRTRYYTVDRDTGQTREVLVAPENVDVMTVNIRTAAVDRRSMTPVRELTDLRLGQDGRLRDSWTGKLPIRQLQYDPDAGQFSFGTRAQSGGGQVLSRGNGGGGGPGAGGGGGTAARSTGQGSQVEVEQYPPVTLVEDRPAGDASLSGRAQGERGAPKEKESAPAVRGSDPAGGSGTGGGQQRDPGGSGTELEDPAHVAHLREDRAPQGANQELPGSRGDRDSVSSDPVSAPHSTRPTTPASSRPSNTVAAKLPASGSSTVEPAPRTPDRHMSAPQTQAPPPPEPPLSSPRPASVSLPVAEPTIWGITVQPRLQSAAGAGYHISVVPGISQFVLHRDGADPAAALRSATTAQAYPGRAVLYLDPSIDLRDQGDLAAVNRVVTGLRAATNEPAFVRIPGRGEQFTQAEMQRINERILGTGGRGLVNWPNQRVSGEITANDLFLPAGSSGLAVEDGPQTGWRGFAVPRPVAATTPSPADLRPRLESGLVPVRTGYRLFTLPASVDRPDVETADRAAALASSMPRPSGVALVVVPGRVDVEAQTVETLHGPLTVAGLREVLTKPGGPPELNGQVAVLFLDPAATRLNAGGTSLAGALADGPVRGVVAPSGYVVPRGRTLGSEHLTEAESGPAPERDGAFPWYSFSRELGVRPIGDRLDRPAPGLPWLTAAQVSALRERGEVLLNVRTDGDGLFRSVLDRAPEVVARRLGGGEVTVERMRGFASEDFLRDFERRPEHYAAFGIDRRRAEQAARDLATPRSTAAVAGQIAPQVVMMAFDLDLDVLNPDGSISRLRHDVDDPARVTVQLAGVSKVEGFGYVPRVAAGHPRVAGRLNKRVDVAPPARPGGEPRVSFAQSMALRARGLAVISTPIDGDGLWHSLQQAAPRWIEAILRDEGITEVTPQDMRQSVAGRLRWSPDGLADLGISPAQAVRIAADLEEPRSTGGPAGEMALELAVRAWGLTVDVVHPNGAVTTLGVETDADEPRPTLVRLRGEQGYGFRPARLTGPAHLPAGLYVPVAGVTTAQLSRFIRMPRQDAQLVAAGFSDSGGAVVTAWGQRYEPSAFNDLLTQYGVLPGKPVALLDARTGRPAPEAFVEQLRRVRAAKATPADPQTTGSAPATDPAAGGSARAAEATPTDPAVEAVSWFEAATLSYQLDSPSSHRAGEELLPVPDGWQITALDRGAFLGPVGAPLPATSSSTGPVLAIGTPGAAVPESIWTLVDRALSLTGFPARNLHIMELTSEPAPLPADNDTRPSDQDLADYWDMVVAIGRGMTDASTVEDYRRGVEEAHKYLVAANPRQAKVPLPLRLDVFKSRIDGEFNYLKWVVDIYQEPSTQDPKAQMPPGYWKELFYSRTPTLFHEWEHLKQYYLIARYLNWLASQGRTSAELGKLSPVARKVALQDPLVPGSAEFAEAERLHTALFDKAAVRRTRVLLHELTVANVAVDDATAHFVERRADPKADPLDVARANAAVARARAAYATLQNEYQRLPAEIVPQYAERRLRQMPTDLTGDIVKPPPAVDVSTAATASAETGDAASGNGSGRTDTVVAQPSSLPPAPEPARLSSPLRPGIVASASAESGPGPVVVGGQVRLVSVAEAGVGWPVVVAGSGTRPGGVLEVYEGGAVRWSDSDDVLDSVWFAFGQGGFVHPRSGTWIRFGGQIQRLNPGSGADLRSRVESVERTPGGLMFDRREVRLAYPPEVVDQSASVVDDDEDLFGLSDVSDEGGTSGSWDAGSPAAGRSWGAMLEGGGEVVGGRVGGAVGLGVASASGPATVNPLDLLLVGGPGAGLDLSGEVVDRPASVVDDARLWPDGFDDVPASGSSGAGSPVVGPSWGPLDEYGPGGPAGGAVGPGVEPASGPATVNPLDLRIGAAGEPGAGLGESVAASVRDQVGVPDRVRDWAGWTIEQPPDIAATFDGYRIEKNGSVELRVRGERHGIHVGERFKALDGVVSLAFAHPREGAGRDVFVVRRVFRGSEGVVEEFRWGREETLTDAEFATFRELREERVVWEVPGNSAWTTGLPEDTVPVDADFPIDDDGRIKFIVAKVQRNLGVVRRSEALGGTVRLRVGRAKNGNVRDVFAVRRVPDSWPNGDVEQFVWIDRVVLTDEGLKDFVAQYQYLYQPEPGGGAGAGRDEVEGAGAQGGQDYPGGWTRRPPDAVEITLKALPIGANGRVTLAIAGERLDTSVVTTIDGAWQDATIDVLLGPPENETGRPEDEAGRRKVYVARRVYLAWPERRAPWVDWVWPDRRASIVEYKLVAHKVVTEHDADGMRRREEYEPGPSPLPTGNSGRYVLVQPVDAGAGVAVMPGGWGGRDVPVVHGLPGSPDAGGAVAGEVRSGSAWVPWSVVGVRAVLALARERYAVWRARVEGSVVLFPPHPFELALEALHGQADGASQASQVAGVRDRIGAALAWYKEVGAWNAVVAELAAGLVAGSESYGRVADGQRIDLRPWADWTRLRPPNLAAFVDGYKPDRNGIVTYVVRGEQREIQVGESGTFVGAAVALLFSRPDPDDVRQVYAIRRVRVDQARVQLVVEEFRWVREETLTDRELVDLAPRRAVTTVLPLSVPALTSPQAGDEDAAEPWFADPRQRMLTAATWQGAGWTRQRPVDVELSLERMPVGRRGAVLYSADGTTHLIRVPAPGELSRSEVEVLFGKADERNVRPVFVGRARTVIRGEYREYTRAAKDILSRAELEELRKRYVLPRDADGDVVMAGVVGQPARLSSPLPAWTAASTSTETVPGPVLWALGDTPLDIAFDAGPRRRRAGAKGRPVAGEQLVEPYWEQDGAFRPVAGQVLYAVRDGKVLGGREVVDVVDQPGGRTTVWLTRWRYASILGVTAPSDELTSALGDLFERSGMDVATAYRIDSHDYGDDVSVFRASGPEIQRGLFAKARQLYPVLARASDDRKAAEAALQELADYLTTIENIPELEVVLDPALGMLGRYQGRLVAVQPGDPDLMLEVILHEVMHAVQWYLLYRLAAGTGNVDFFERFTWALDDKAKARAARAWDEPLLPDDPAYPVALALFRERRTNPDTLPLFYALDKARKTAETSIAVADGVEGLSPRIRQRLWADLRAVQHQLGLAAALTESEVIERQVLHVQLGLRHLGSIRDWSQDLARTSLRRPDGKALSIGAAGVFVGASAERTSQLATERLADGARLRVVMMVDDPESRPAGTSVDDEARRSALAAALVDAGRLIEQLPENLRGLAVVELAPNWRMAPTTAAGLAQESGMDLRVHVSGLASQPQGDRAMWPLRPNTTLGLAGWATEYVFPVGLDRPPTLIVGGHIHSLAVDEPTRDLMFAGGRAVMTGQVLWVRTGGEPRDRPEPVGNRWPKAVVVGTADRPTPWGTAMRARELTGLMTGVVGRAEQADLIHVHNEITEPPPRPVVPHPAAVPSGTPARDVLDRLFGEETVDPALFAVEWKGVEPTRGVLHLLDALIELAVDDAGGWPTIEALAERPDRLDELADRLDDLAHRIGIARLAGAQSRRTALLDVAQTTTRMFGIAGLDQSRLVAGRQFTQLDGADGWRRNFADLTRTTNRLFGRADDDPKQFLFERRLVAELAGQLAHLKLPSPVAFEKLADDVAAVTAAVHELAASATLVNKDVLWLGDVGEVWSAGVVRTNHLRIGYLAEADGTPSSVVAALRRVDQQHGVTEPRRGSWFGWLPMLVQSLMDAPGSVVRGRSLMVRPEGANPTETDGVSQYLKQKPANFLAAERFVWEPPLSRPLVWPGGEPFAGQRVPEGFEWFVHDVFGDVDPSRYQRVTSASGLGFTMSNLVVWVLAAAGTQPGDARAAVALSELAGEVGLPARARPVDLLDAVYTTAVAAGLDVLSKERLTDVVGLLTTLRGSPEGPWRVDSADLAAELALLAPETAAVPARVRLLRALDVTHELGRPTAGAVRAAALRDALQQDHDWIVELVRAAEEGPAGDWWLGQDERPALPTDPGAVVLGYQVGANLGPVVPAVGPSPVRSTEASMLWLADAIRTAAGRPDARVLLVPVPPPDLLDGVWSSSWRIDRFGMRPDLRVTTHAPLAPVWFTAAAQTAPGQPVAPEAGAVHETVVGSPARLSDAPAVRQLAEQGTAAGPSVPAAVAELLPPAVLHQVSAELALAPAKVEYAVGDLLAGIAARPGEPVRDARAWVDELRPALGVLAPTDNHLVWYIELAYRVRTGHGDRAAYEWLWHRRITPELVLLLPEDLARTTVDNARQASVMDLAAAAAELGLSGPAVLEAVATEWGATPLDVALALRSEVARPVGAPAPDGGQVVSRVRDTLAGRGYWSREVISRWIRLTAGLGFDPRRLAGLRPSPYLDWLLYQALGDVPANRAEQAITELVTAGAGVEGPSGSRAGTVATIRPWSGGGTRDEREFETAASWLGVAVDQLRALPPAAEVRPVDLVGTGLSVEQPATLVSLVAHTGRVPHDLPNLALRFGAEPGWLLALAEALRRDPRDLMLFQGITDDLGGTPQADWPEPRTVADYLADEVDRHVTGGSGRDGATWLYRLAGSGAAGQGRTGLYPAQLRAMAGRLGSGAVAVDDAAAQAAVNAVGPAAAMLGRYAEPPTVVNVAAGLIDQAAGIIGAIRANASIGDVAARVVAASEFVEEQLGRGQLAPAPELIGLKEARETVAGAGTELENLRRAWKTEADANRPVPAPHVAAAARARETWGAWQVLDAGVGYLGAVKTLATLVLRAMDPQATAAFDAQAAAGTADPSAAAAPVGMTLWLAEAIDGLASARDGLAQARLSNPTADELAAAAGIWRVAHADDDAASWSVRAPLAPWWAERIGVAASEIVDDLRDRPALRHAAIVELAATLGADPAWVRRMGIAIGTVPSGIPALADEWSVDPKFLLGVAGKLGIEPTLLAPARPLLHGGPASATVDGTAERIAQLASQQATDVARTVGAVLAALTTAGRTLQATAKPSDAPAPGTSAKPSEAPPPDGSAKPADVPSPDGSGKAAEASSAGVVAGDERGPQTPAAPGSETPIAPPAGQSPRTPAAGTSETPATPPATSTVHKPENLTGHTPEAPVMPPVTTPALPPAGSTAETPAKHEPEIAAETPAVTTAETPAVIAAVTPVVTTAETPAVTTAETPATPAVDTSTTSAGVPPKAPAQSGTTGDSPAGPLSEKAAGKRADEASSFADDWLITPDWAASRRFLAENREQIRAQDLDDLRAEGPRQTAWLKLHRALLTLDAHDRADRGYDWLEAEKSPKQRKDLMAGAIATGNAAVVLAFVQLFEVYGRREQQSTKTYEWESAIAQVLRQFGEIAAHPDAVDLDLALTQQDNAKLGRGNTKVKLLYAMFDAVELRPELYAAVDRFGESILDCPPEEIVEQVSAQFENPPLPPLLA